MACSGWKCQTQHSSTHQEHWQQIEKVNKAGVWVPYNRFEENKDKRSTTATYFISGTITNHIALSTILAKHNAIGFRFIPITTTFSKW